MALYRASIWYYIVCVRIRSKLYSEAIESHLPHADPGGHPPWCKTDVRNACAAAATAACQLADLSLLRLKEQEVDRAQDNHADERSAHVEDGAGFRLSVPSPQLRRPAHTTGTD
eukprot:COSAG05_NODE_1263_length_5338_cov_44.046956_3_plen_114_part_00